MPNYSRFMQGPKTTVYAFGIVRVDRDNAHPRGNAPQPQRNCILGSRAVTSCDVTMGLNRLAPVVTRRKTLNFGSRCHGIGM